MEWRLPELGEGVHEGEVVKWMVKEGDTVKIDQVLLQIMTDKATMEIPSTFNGTAKKLIAKEGDVVAVNDVLGEFDTGAGASAPAKSAEKAPAPSTPASTPAPAAASKAAVTTAAVVNETPLASPAVRQLARDMGLDLKTVAGSGPGGRILKDDLKSGGTAKAPAASRPSTGFGSLPVGQLEERVPLRGLRRKIAEKMVHSRHTAAHFTHIDEADFTNLMKLRKDLKPSADERGVKLTFLPFIVKAVVNGFKAYPQLNVSIDDEKNEIVYKKYFNISVAVATDDGLIVPVVKNADQLSILGIANEINRLGEAARNKTITVDDLRGGCMSLTNIGTIGGILSAPIINHPESLIMGLHEIKKRPMVVGDEIKIREMMYMSISADHRVIDGADVAKFLNMVIDYIEQPELLLLDAI